MLEEARKAVKRCGGKGWFLAWLSSSYDKSDLEKIDERMGKAIRDFQVGACCDHCLRLSKQCMGYSAVSRGAVSPLAVSRYCCHDATHMMRAHLELC